MKKVKVPKTLQSLFVLRGLPIDVNGFADLFDLLNFAMEKGGITGEDDDDGQAASAWLGLVSKQNNLTDYSFVVTGTIAPFGGPGARSDCIGEYFSPNTDFKLDAGLMPVIVYGHGHEYNSRGASEEVIGRVLTRWIDPELGLRAKLGIRRDTKYHDEIWDAYKNGSLAFSTKALLKKRSTDGELLVWLIGETSVYTDQTATRPCDVRAVADKFDEAGSDPNQLWVERILELQSQDTRDQIIALMQIGGIDTEVAISDNINPTLDQPNNLADFDDLGETMKPEEIAAMQAELATAKAELEKLRGAATEKGEGGTPCNCGGTETKPADTSASSEDDEKGAGLTAAISAKVAKMTANGVYTKGATQLVQAADIAPEKHAEAIAQVATLLENVGMEKGESIIDTVLASYKTVVTPVNFMGRSDTAQAKKGDVTAATSLAQQVAKEMFATNGGGQ